jgi:hypothetical protein
MHKHYKMVRQRIELQHPPGVGLKDWHQHIGHAGTSSLQPFCKTLSPSAMSNCHFQGKIQWEMD